MLDNRVLKAASMQFGFTLIELMVAIVLALLITAAVTAMTVNNLKMSGNTLKSARLNQDMGSVMQIMVNEIRRAGYTAGTVSYADGGDIAIRDVDGDESPDDGDCLLYSYNRDSVSPIDKEEMNGFKLEDGAIQMRTSCTGTECPTDCTLDTDEWVNLTDPEIITITAFEIDSGNSKCHNIDEVVSVRIAPGVSAMEFACNEPDEDNLQEGVVDDDGDWSWGTLTIEMDESDSLKKYGSADPIYSVGVRHVNILLRGVFNDPFVEAGSDYNEYPIKKSLDVSIKVRNDHVYKYEP